MTKFNNLIDAQVRLLQAHILLVEEMQRTAQTKNRLAGSVRLKRLLTPSCPYPTFCR